MANSSFATRNPFDTRSSQPASAAPGDDPLLELARLVGADDPFADLFRAAGVQRAADPGELRGSAEVELEDYAEHDEDHDLGVYGEAADLRGRHEPSRAEPSWTAPRQARAPEPADDFDDDAQDWAAASAPRDLDEDAAPASGRAALRGMPKAEGLFRLGARSPIDQRQPARAHDDFEDEDDHTMTGELSATGALEEPAERTGFRPGGAMIAAAVVGLAVIGGGGGLAYWQMSGSVESDGPPPVIKAEVSPTKVVPSNPGGADIPHQNKLVYDRVGGSGQPAQERLAAKPQDPIASVPAATQAAGSPGVAVEPRRVRTVVVKPDGTLVNGTAEAPPAAMAMAPTAPASPASSADQTAALPYPSAASTTAAPLPSAQRSAPVKPLAPVAEIKPRPAPVSTQAAPTQLAAAPSAASLNSIPSATAAQPVAAPSRSTASLGATASVASGGESWSVQLASQRTEDQARAAYQGLQQKYSSVLAGQQPQLQKAELADKGTYYRVRLAMGSRDSAVQLCANLKAAGGDCLVQKN